MYIPLACTVISIGMIPSEETNVFTCLPTELKTTISCVSYAGLVINNFPFVGLGYTETADCNVEMPTTPVLI